MSSVCEVENTPAALPEWDQNSPPAPSFQLRPHCLTVAWHLIPAGNSAFDVAQTMRYPSRDMPRPLIFPAWSHARHWLRSQVTVSLKGVVIVQHGKICGGCMKKWLLDSSLHSSSGCEERRERERERCVIMKSSAMNQWGRGDAHVLGGPLIGDHVFVADRLWNGVLLHGCGAPASHQGDWLVWSCGMFPSGLQ